MIEAEKKLLRDLVILEKMSEAMGGYLRASALFGRMGPSFPALTLGGYLMRQHRLLALQEVLNESNQARLKSAVYQFNTLISNEIVRSEKRATEEYGARMRQWEAFVRDLRRNPQAHQSGYKTGVESRAMLEALFQFLSTPPYRFNMELRERLDLLDGGLKGMWDMGDFVWEEGFELAYPIKMYWWLYGTLKTGER